MKSGVKILVWMLILILLVAIIYFFNYKIKVKEANQKAYEFLECVSNCPSILFNNTINVLEPNCGNKCREIMNKTSENLRANNAILNSKEHLSCLDLWSNEKDFEKVKTCFKEILPKLREKI